MAQPTRRNKRLLSSGDAGGAGPARLTIGDVARRAHVPLSTARLYDRAGLLTGTMNANGRRMYSAADVDRIRFAVKARAHGISLTELRDTLSIAESSAPNQGVVAGLLTGLDARIESLQRLRAIIIDLAEDPRPAGDALRAAADQLGRDGTPT